MSSRSKAGAGNIAIVNIRRDGGTQIRVGLDEATVEEYVELIKAGIKFPPVGVYQDGPLQQGTAFWLWDGFHRVEAYSRAGVERIEADFRMGTRRDALRAACGANADHGLRRSNADKRRAVETFLSDPEWSEWSDGAIAKEAHVSRQTVTNIRAELANLPVGPRRVKGLDGRERTIPAALCCNGDGRPVQPPSAVLCSGCLAALDAKMQALGAPKDSAPGQTTSAPTPAENPEAEGEKGAGATDGHPASTPAPDEPRDRLINVERMLRDAQAELAPLLAKGEGLAVQSALVDALFLVRAAIERPANSALAEEASKKKNAEGRGGRAEEADPSRTPVRERAAAPSSDGAQAADSPASPSNAAPARAGWPSPPRPVASRRHGVRVVLETPTGDVAYEDVSQAADDAG